MVCDGAELVEGFFAVREGYTWMEGEHPKQTKPSCTEKLPMKLYILLVTGCAFGSDS